MGGEQEEFETHPGPLLAGDLIVIEIGGKIVPRRPNDLRPQWFVCLNHQDGESAVSLEPFNNPTRAHKARKYVAGWVG